VEDCVVDFTHNLRIAHSRQQQDGGVVKCTKFLLTIHTRRQFADKIKALKPHVAGGRRERYKIDDELCCCLVTKRGSAPFCVVR
jgi:hypothetical protein